MIYLLAEVDPSGARTGLVKIGYTGAASSAARLTDCQIGNPRKLVLLCEMEGRRNDELRLHREFAQMRVRGEWFALPPAAFDLIAQTSRRLLTPDKLITGFHYQRRRSALDQHKDDLREIDKAFVRDDPAPPQPTPPDDAGPAAGGAAVGGIRRGHLYLVGDDRQAA